MSETETLLEKLREFYSETTIEHILQPRNVYRIPNPDGYAEMRSGCGETMKIWLRIDGDTVTDAGFWTDGCAATIACGSMTVTLAAGKSLTEMFRLDAQRIADALDQLPQGNLHCAELAADTLQAALRESLSMRRQPWVKLYRNSH